MENNNKFECYICLNSPRLPVATPCGHMFCWKCLKSWWDHQTILQCPVCKNGFERNRLVKLYSNEDNDDQNDDRPKAEKMAPGINNEKEPFYKSILNSFGFYGTQRRNNINEPMQLPNDKEVKANRWAWCFLILGISVIIFLFWN